MTKSKVIGKNNKGPVSEHEKEQIGAELKVWLKPMVRFVLPIACSAALVCWLFHKVNFGDMMEVLRHNVNYWCLLGLMACVMMSYLIRAKRWGLQLNGIGVQVSYQDLCVSIFGAYGLNLLLYGAGEAWRCIFISRKTGASLSSVVGTDVGDRISDLACILLLLGLMVIVARTDLNDFLMKYQVGREIDHIIDDWHFWAIVVGVVSTLCWLYHLLRNYQFMKRVHGSVQEIWHGFVILFSMKKRGEYLWLTLAIWLCYYLQNYICFPGFPFTDVLMRDSLGLVPGLVVCVFVSMSMAVPSSGGLGPWNIAMIFALTLYNVPNTEAVAFAMLLWAAQALTQVVVGIYAMVYVSAVHKKKKLKGTI